MSGLSINKDDFKSLKTNEKLDIIFENLEYVKELSKRQMFHTKLHYYWISAITAVLGGVVGFKFI